MSILMTILALALFFALTPGVLTTLPSAASPLYTVAAVHGLIFVIVFYIIKKIIYTIFPRANKFRNKRRNP